MLQPLPSSITGHNQEPVFSSFRRKAHKSHCGDRRWFGRSRDTSPSSHNQLEPPGWVVPGTLQQPGWLSQVFLAGNEAGRSACRSLSERWNPEGMWLPTSNPLPACSSSEPAQILVFLLDFKGREKNKIKQNCSQGTDFIQQTFPPGDSCSHSTVLSGRKHKKEWHREEKVLGKPGSTLIPEP